MTHSHNTHYALEGACLFFSVCIARVALNNSRGFGFRDCFSASACLKINARNGMLFSTKLTKSFLICAFAVKWLGTHFFRVVSLFSTQIIKRAIKLRVDPYTLAAQSRRSRKEQFVKCLLLGWSAIWRMSDI